jgi:thiol-disulfide isomerase/thioredoxin
MNTGLERVAADGTDIRAARRNMRRAVLRALCVAAGAGLLPGPARAGARLAVGKPAPALSLHTLDGRDISTASLLGQVVILTFWASWCEPCRDELPLLSRFAERHARNGLQVLGFSLDDPTELPTVRRIAAGLSFPVGLLGSPWAGDYGRIWRLPVNFTIDRNGLLADDGWHDETPTWTEARLERVILPLLDAGRSAK